MIDKETLIAALNQNTGALLKLIAAFDDARFNEVPFAGSWTAGQVADHLLQSESGIPETLEGSTRITERKADEMVPVIASIFLDFSTKMKSPDFILPSDGHHDPKAYYEKFRHSRSQLGVLIEALDLTVTCTSFPFPQLGELTRYEWLNFGLCHAKRHTHQMENIYSKLV